MLQGFSLRLAPHTQGAIASGRANASRFYLLGALPRGLGHGTRGPGADQHRCTDGSCCHSCLLHPDLLQKCVPNPAPAEVAHLPRRTYQSGSRAGKSSVNTALTWSKDPLTSALQSDRYTVSCRNGALAGGAVDRVCSAVRSSQPRSCSPQSAWCWAAASTRTPATHAARRDPCSAESSPKSASSHCCARRPPE